jgi:large subunit ribosomal protein L22
MNVQAVAKGVRMSPRKVGVVAALVRGRTVSDALVILEHTPRRSADPVYKAVASAKANAEHNHNLKPDTLKIVEISVSPGPRLKRYRPVARGMAHPFQRRTSHIRVVVTGDERVAKTPATVKKAAAKEAAKKEAK